LPYAVVRAIPCVGRDSLIDRTGLDQTDPATAAALARLYDLDLVDDPGDLDLYLALADRADGPVLELAAGTGRLAVPLAEAGHLVTAVDIDPAMLARARARLGASGVPGAADRLRLVEADLVGLRLPTGDGYGLAFIALNSLLVLPTRAAQRAAVQALADHLAPGGLAAIDVWIPDAEDLARYDGRISLEWPRLDPETGAIVTKSGAAQHDAASASITITTIFEEGGQGAATRRWVRRDRLRLVSAEELRAFAEEAGLTVELLAGDYGMGPMGPGSDRAVLIAVKP
jgi:SAM-dependent methyltransferase